MSSIPVSLCRLLVKFLSQVMNLFCLQDAAAALADIKRDALRTSQRPRRPRHLQQQQHR